MKIVTIIEEVEDLERIEDPRMYSLTVFPNTEAAFFAAKKIFQAYPSATLYFHEEPVFEGDEYARYLQMSNDEMSKFLDRFKSISDLKLNSEEYKEMKRKYNKNYKEVKADDFEVTKL